MTNKLKNWSTTPGSNNSSPPDGAPEGMAPSTVNNVIRENMARLREWYEDPMWLDFGWTISANDATTITLSGDQTAYFTADRPIRINGTTADYVSSSSYGGSNTVVTVVNGGLGTVTTLEVGAITSEEMLSRKSYFKGLEYGFGLALAADTDHDITITYGAFTDTTGTKQVTTGGTITKQIDAAWAEGTNLGGYASGATTLAANLFVYIHMLIQEDGTVDAGYDTSATAANLLTDATDFPYYLPIGAFYTDASANIEAFYLFSEIGQGKCEITISSSVTLPAIPNVSSIPKVLIQGAGGGGSGNSGVEAGAAGGDSAFDGITAGGGAGGVFDGSGGGGGAISGISSSNVQYVGFSHIGQEGKYTTGADGGESGISWSFVGYAATYPNLFGANAAGDATDGTGGGGGGQVTGGEGGGGGATIMLEHYPVSGTTSVTVGAGGGGFGGAGGDGGDGVVKLWI